MILIKVVLKKKNALGKAITILFLFVYPLDKPGCFQSTLEMCRAPSYDCAEPSGIITSPSYPMPFDGTMRCLWRINTPGNSYIQIVFTNYTLPPPSTRCSESMVRIREKPFGPLVTLGECCSTRAPPDSPIESNLNFVELELDTGPGGNGLIFMIEYKALLFETPLTAQSENDKGTCSECTISIHLYYSFDIMHIWSVRVCDQIQMVSGVG